MAEAETPRSTASTTSAYTSDEVDDILRALETATQRQIATRNSAVKGVAAERDLLSQAEKARNLLVKSLKSDKVQLDRVYGGETCERIGRLRVILDSVALSDMHASDARWKDLRNSVDSIEAVLKEMGSFKPWKPATLKSPEAVAYKTSKRTMSPGRRVSWKPEVIGGEVTTFRVEPPLPDGLVLNPQNGSIIGAVKPGIFFEETTFVVTASNDAGETTAEITFAVQNKPPTELAYPTAVSELETGDEVSWEAQVAGGKATEFLCSLPLPAGLTLDPSTGLIAGVPAEGAEDAAYEVTAGNSGGKVSTSLQLCVKIAAPKHLAYPDHEVGALFAVGAPIRLVPKATAGLTYSVEPALPQGLALGESDGVIEGTSLSASEPASYEVTGRNAGGQLQVNLNFGLELRPPALPNYSDFPEKLKTGEAVSATPQAVGLVSEWSIDPVLPAGLSFDASTGTIAGSPAEAVPLRSWAVTARNAAGEASTTVSFLVEVTPPSLLEYHGVESEYPLHRPVALHPTVEGLVENITVSPDLPPGLSLGRSGGITGTPTQVSELTAYEVVASNVSGSISTSLSFAVRLLPPSALAYPSADEAYAVGEQVALEPELEGGATKFVVEPPLPRGLNFASDTGIISGVAKAVTDATEYKITASNDAGEISTVIRFEVTLSPPGDFTYPTMADMYPVGEVALMEPDASDLAGCSFSIEPALPAGLALNARTGVISGEPQAETEEQRYKVTAKNSAGASWTEITFSVDHVVVVETINVVFAETIDAITDIAEMVDVEEPQKTKAFGDWMVWMVHRAHLNDPTLIEFSFSNMHMPPPHMEDRIAPKLVRAMKTNTHIQHLTLANSNLQRASGLELAESLKHNTTLRSLNLEANCLDSNAVREMIVGLRDNDGTQLELFRVQQQKGVGQFFGRPVEEAMGSLMEKNNTIYKLGFECNDAHWRNEIDRALLRNNDYARRRRKRTSQIDAEVRVEERPLSRILLLEPPANDASSVFSDDNASQRVFRSYLAQNKKMPTMPQLQAYAKSNGTPLKYAEVAPLMKECRSIMLDSAMNREVTAYDVFEVDTKGVLRGWSQDKENWNLEVWTGDGKRYAYKSNKEPGFSVSEAWAEWLNQAPP